MSKRHKKHRKEQRGVMTVADGNRSFVDFTRIQRALPIKGLHRIPDAWGSTNLPYSPPPGPQPQATVERSYVFAYGSNMDWTQMHRRCPESRFSGVGRLRGYRLAFGGHSGWWGGAVATMVECQKSSVEGVIYSATNSDLCRLDAFEGAPTVYAVRALTVHDGLNQKVVCRVYILRKLEKTGPPGPKYLAQIQQSYQDFGFDMKRLYRAAMEAVR